MIGSKADQSDIADELKGRGGSKDVEGEMWEGTEGGGTQPVFKQCCACCARKRFWRRTNLRCLSYGIG